MSEKELRQEVMRLCHQFKEAQRRIIELEKRLGEGAFLLKEYMGALKVHMDTLEAKADFAIQPYMEHHQWN